MNNYGKSIPFMFDGNISNVLLLRPDSGKRLVVKGMTISGNGDAGVVKITRSSDNACILPYYFDNKTGGKTSANLNLILKSNEAVLITTKNRENFETFVSISYLEI